MDIGYAMLEQMLMRLFALSDSQRAGLAGRFKYIMRSNALRQTKIGRGRAQYDLEDILRIVLIFELEDAGCTPAHAARIVRNHWGDLRINFGAAWCALKTAETAQEDALFWTVVPHLLREIGAYDTDEQIVLGEAAGDLAPADVLEWPSSIVEGDRHAIFVNLRLLLAACCEVLGGLAPRIERDFRTALDRLAEQTGQEPSRRHSLV